MISTRLERLLEMQAQDASDPFLAFAIAKEYDKMGDREKAVEIYLGLIKNNPNYVGTYYHAGKLMEEMGKAGSAEEIYGKGLEVTRAVGDQHAYNELKGALALLTGDEEDD